MVIKTGKPTVTTTSSAALGQAVAQTTPSDINVSTLIGNVLAEFGDAALIVVDPQTGQVNATSDAATMTDLRAAIAASTILDVAPDAGQTGRSLTFSAVAGNNLAGLDALDITTAVKPKMTVETIASKLLAKIQDREATVPADANKFLVVIDQVNKKVGIRKMNGAKPDFTTIDFAAASGVQIDLTPSESAPASNPLPFEGGAV